MNPTIENIVSRRSIRSYKDTPVDRKTIEMLLKAGMAAPSASNRQPWELIVVTNRDTLGQLVQAHPYAKMLIQAPVCIIVCGNRERFYQDEEVQGYWVQDCSAATENILVAAASLGLGTCWCGMFPARVTVGSVSKVLELPGGVIPLNLIALGYPNEDPPVKDKWRPDRVHWEQW